MDTDPDKTLTAQETRFLRLAVARKALSADQAKTLIQFRQEKLKTGSKIALWDCTILQNMLDESMATRLQEEAGDLNVEKLGDSKIIRRLGEGAMGSVWLAVGPNKERVAIKLLSKDLARQPQFLKRFFREAQSCIKLKHPNIVSGIAVGEDAGHYFFAMEFVQGESVADMLEKSGVLSVDKATDIVLQVARGLAFAHAHGIIHRDIKPDNIMVTREGVAKVADLGLARRTDADLTALTTTGTSMGTPLYMPPEQGTDAKRADARSDIYSLGATWYHMVTGRPPFEGSSPLEILQKHHKEPLKPPETVRTGIPRGVSLTIQRMMAKVPERRIQTAEELCRIIEENCLGKRDIVKELGLKHEKKAEEPLWDVKVKIGDRIERRRLSLSELRVRIRKGQVTRDSPARRAGTRAPFEPAGTFRELEREFPRQFAAPTIIATKTEKPTRTSELHELVTHIDKKQRAYRRKKKLKKLVPHIVELVIIAALAVAVWRFWPQISGFISGLIGKVKGGS